MEHKYVFISYSSANKAVADAACHILEECGIPCWIAPRNIIPGNTWAGNIVQAIRECSLMVLIYSADSNSSSQVANEVDKAFSHSKTIIPFMVDSTPMNDDFDYYLSRKHWLVAYPDYKEMLMPLVEAVATNIGVEIRIPQPKPQTAPAHSEAPRSGNSPSAGHPYETAIETARKALQNYEIDMAFAELIRPALDDFKEAQFLMRTILIYYPRMQRIDTFRFKYVKEKADAGNAFAQYAMSYFHIHIERNPEESFRYAGLCAAQGKEYGFQALSWCYEMGTGVKPDMMRSHELLDKAVNQDDPFAMLHLAKDYLYGLSRKRNPRQAFILLKRCMEVGVPESFAEMGDMYSEGNGVACDRQRALELYHRALDEGYPEALHNIACYYMFDMTTGKYRDKTEIRQGISRLHKGIECGVAECLSTLAYCHQKGIGVPENAEKALRLYKKAAEAGNPGAYFRVGSMYYYGEGCRKNDASAWEWLVRGSKIPNGNCCYLLGLMCQDGHGQEGKTEADCVYYYEASLRLGGTYACESAIHLYNIFRTPSLESAPLLRAYGNTVCNYDWAPKDNHRAMNCLKRAAGMNNDTSGVYFKYGAILCTEGHGFTDEVEGIPYLKLAAEKGEVRAMLMLAQIYEKGELADKDLEKARAYYQLAADGGFGDGYAGLARIACAQIIDTTDQTERRKLISQVYTYVKQADILTCKTGCPLEEVMTAFMLEDRLLTPAERNGVIEMNERYARLGSLQCLVDRGVMFHMGILTGPDTGKAILAYLQAARLGSECAAGNLGNLYSGAAPALQDKPAAAYWYAKDSSSGSQAESTRLREEGHRMVMDFEHTVHEKDQSEYLKWVFPYLCDPAFTSAASRLRIFEWAHFSGGPLTGEIPQSTSTDIRYLPEVPDNLYNSYIQLYCLLTETYGWNSSLLPHLNKDDFFPALSMTHLQELTQMIYQVWISYVKQGKDGWLRQQEDKMRQITLMRHDWDAISELAGKCPDSNLQTLLTQVVNICHSLEIMAEQYWQLIALNHLVENSDNAGYRLPENFVRKMAGWFFDGTRVLPRSRTIAHRLNMQIPSLPDV